MRLPAVSLVATLVVAFAATSLAQDGLNPMRNVTAYSAAGGVVIVENSADHPFVLRIVGGDPRRISTAENQLWIPVGNLMFQMLITLVADVMPDAKIPPADRAVLAAHAVWECQDHNETMQEQQVAKPEFQEIAGRTWCHWTYDLTAVARRLAQDPAHRDDGLHAQTQHLLTTVVGQKIAVLIANTLTGQKEEDTLKALQAAARTFVTPPKPLTRGQIQELCAQKQP